MGDYARGPWIDSGDRAAAYGREDGEWGSGIPTRGPSETSVMMAAVETAWLDRLRGSVRLT